MMNFLTESLNEPIDGDFLITSGRESQKAVFADALFFLMRAELASIL